jgi:tetratricopeptide (TPR) repeat protein
VAAGAAILAFGVLISLYFTISPGANPAPLDIDGGLLARVQAASRTTVAGYVPLPILAGSFGQPLSFVWNTSFFDGFTPLQMVLALCLVLLPPLMFVRRPAAMVLLVSGTAALWIAYGRYAPDVRHGGHIFLLWLGACWIAPRCSESRVGRIQRWWVWGVLAACRPWLLTAILILHMLVGVATSLFEMRGSFSGSREAADIIRRQFPADIPIVGDADWAACSVAGYLDRPLFYISREEFGTFVIYDHLRRFGPLPPPLFRDRLIHFLATQNRDVLLLLDYKVVIPEGSRFRLVANVDRSIVSDEKYQLILARNSWGDLPELTLNYPEAYLSVANELAGQGKLDEAIAQYRKALELQPDLAPAHVSLGTALARSGQLDSAIAQYEKALEINPDFAEAHNNLGNALVRRGRIDQAIAHYQAALEIKPDYADAHYNLANTLLGRGQADSAIVHYQKAIEINPRYVEAHTDLGTVLALHGQLDSAIDHYQQALKIKPDYALARKNLAAVLSQREKILKSPADLHRQPPSR